MVMKAAHAVGSEVEADLPQLTHNNCGELWWVVGELWKTRINGVYWAGGSIEKVFQLLLAVLAAFGLRQRMADELEVELNATNAQVTSSINGAVQILKACESEEQRQQYRVVMTAAAPPLVKKGDHSGQQSDVADAIGVNRKSVPYMESVQKRKAIEAAAAARKKPIAVGDTVCCKHGTGTLVEYNGPDNPCAVKICVDDHEPGLPGIHCE